jgi:hypothetical protein
MYPLLVLTTAERRSAAVADRLIGFQAAASALGAAVIPPLIGLAMGVSVHLMIEQITDWIRVVLHHTKNGALPNPCQKAVVRPIAAGPKRSSRRPAADAKPNRAAAEE